MQVVGRNEPDAGPGMAENGDAPWPGRGRNPAREPTSCQPAGFMPWLGGAGSGRPPGPSAPAPVRTRNSCTPHQHDLPQGAAWRRAGNDDTSPGRQRRRERLGSCVAVLARRTAAGLVLALAAALVLATPALAQGNSAPVFSSSASLSVVENQTEVGTVEATDPDSEDSVTYALTGGADLARFELNETTRVLSFSKAPDHESPADVASTNPVNAAGNNEYIVIVTATGGTAGRVLTTEQTLTVTVTGVNEPPVVTSATVSQERAILLPHGSPVTWTFPEALFTDPEDNAEQVLGFALPVGVGGSLHSGYSSGVEALLDVAPVPPSGSIAGGFTMSPAAGLTPEQFVAVYGAVSSRQIQAVVIASDGDHTVTGHVGPTLYVGFDASAYFAGASYEEDQRWALDNAIAVYEGASGNAVGQGAGWTATIAGSRSWHTGTPPSLRLTPDVGCRDAGGSVVDQSTDWPAAGAADSSHFSPVPETTTGAAGLAALSFAQALDYEVPADADGDNVYRVRLYNRHDLHELGVEGSGRLGCSGSGIDLQILVKDAGPPSAPSMVEAAFDLMTTPFDLVVTWEAPAGFVDPATNAVVTEDGPPVIDYDYRYRVQGTPMWTEVTNTEITAATASIAGLGTDKSYEVQVRAESTEGEGDWSASATSASVTVPSVSTVALSSDPGSDATYAIGDAVEARVTFTEAVDVTGTPTLTIDVGGSDKTLGYHSGTGTAALLFTGYTVAERDADPDGIAIGADKLAPGGGAITKDGVSSIDAVLTHDAVAADSGHKVDGVRPTLVTTGGDAPRTSVDGMGVVLTYSEALSATTTPVTAFTVMVVGSSRDVSAVETADTEVTLTLASAVASGEAVTVAYDDPTANDDTNAIQDEAGNDAAGFAAQTVTNDVQSVPSVSTVGLSSDPGGDATYAIGDAVEAMVRFTEAVDVTGTPTLTIDVGGSDETLGYHSGAGTEVLLFTGYTVAESDEDPDGIAIGEDKLAPGGGAITKDGVSSIDAVLTHDAVAADNRHKVDGVRPTLVTTGVDAPRASADGTRVVLIYSEALSATTTPVTAFTVMVEGSSRDVSAVEAAGTEVTLTLASAVASGEAVTVAYDDPTANDDTNAIQDEAGNDAATFAAQTVVTNDVLSVPSVSTVALSSGPGSDATYAIGDAVEAMVRFTEAVDVTGPPTLTIDVGGEDETLGYHSGTGTATLYFTGYTVAEGDEDPDGIAIGEDKLATGGGTITKAGVSASMRADGGGGGQRAQGGRGAPDPGGDGRRCAADLRGRHEGRPHLQRGAVRDDHTGDRLHGDGGGFEPGRERGGGGGHRSDADACLGGGLGRGGDGGLRRPHRERRHERHPGRGRQRRGGLRHRPVRGEQCPVGAERVHGGAELGPGQRCHLRDRGCGRGDGEVHRGGGRDGAPTLTIDVGGSDKTLGYHSGTGTAALLFTGYTVAERDADPDGIAIGEDKLATGGGTITKAGVSGIDTDAVLTHDAVAADSGHKVDGVRPTLVTTGGDAPRTSVDGTRVVLTFSEALSATTTPVTAFTVMVVGSSRDVSAVEAAGTEVTLTLASAVASGEAVTVDYDDPTANDDTNAIQDEAGNDAAGFATARSVANNVPSVPSVSTVALSSDPGSDATYAIGDAVEARVTFTEAVDVTGTPTLTIDVGVSDETLSYHSGTGTAALRFTGYTVAESDADPDGIAIGEDKLAPGGGTITKAGVSSIDAVLTHDAVAADSGHKVDGVRPTLVTTGGDAPRTSADGTRVVLTYNEALSAMTTPVTAFTVMVVGSSRDVSAVEAAGTEVTLTLASAVASGEAVTVDYDDPTANDDTNAIQDEAGNDAAGFATARSVANDVPSVPRVSTVALSSNPGSDATYAIGDAVEARVTFTEAVDVTGTPTLTIDVGGSDETLGYHSGTGTAALRFTGYTVAESDADPDGIAIGEDKLATGGGTITKAGVSSIDAVLTHDAVAADSGHKVDGVRPALVTTGGDAPRTSADGRKVVLTYNEALSATTTPVTAFMVTVAGSSRGVSAVEASGTAVTLTLASEVASGEAVTVAYDDPTANDDTDAIQDASGNDADTVSAQSVTNGSTAARPRLGVSNGHAREGEGETIDFVVQLQPATGAQVTVDYRTEDVTATAGEDYEAASGTLTFSPGETEKTLRVPIVDDDHDDDGETFTLRLSNATGAWIGDGEGTGTIRSTGAMPRAWLARFGRTVSEHVLDAVAGRLSGPRGSGTELRIGGQSIAASGDAEDRENAMVEAETQARVAALADWLEGGDGDPDDPEAGRLTRTRTLTGRELFTGTSFAVTGETAHGGHMAAWGRGAVTRFDGRDGDLAQDGEVLTGMIGADLANGRWKTGLVASRSRGKGDYRSPRGAGEVSSTLTALHPWVGLAVSERLSVWAAAGYGEGRLELTPEGQDPMETDIEYRKGAAGAVNEVLAPGRKDGARLALRTDARFTRTTSEAVTAAARPESSVDGGILSAAQADVWLLRLGVEGSRRFALGERRTGLTPSFEFGLRRDGGDAETGFGVDIGAGLTVSDPRRGLSAELAARGLLAHEASGFREWGASAALGWNPEPSSALGPSASLRHTRGASSTGGTDALLARRTMPGLDTNDDERPGGTLEVELGYGFPVLGGRAVGTPHVGLALRESGETLRLGYRYRVGRALDLGIEASRREPANGNPSGHGLIVRASVRW